MHFGVHYIIQFETCMCFAKNKKASCLIGVIRVTTMNDVDKSIYNTWGSSSSPDGKVSSNLSAYTAPYFILAFCNPVNYIHCKLFLTYALFNAPYFHLWLSPNSKTESEVKIVWFLYQTWRSAGRRIFRTASLQNCGFAEKLHGGVAWVWGYFWCRFAKCMFAIGQF